MLNKINRMLRQQEGFTLMELMIVVVILGILMAIAVPVYQGVQDRARQKVGEANAAMLNRGVRSLEALGYGDTGDDHAFAAGTVFKVSSLNSLKGFLDLEDDDVKYVGYIDGGDGNTDTFDYDPDYVDGTIADITPSAGD